MNLEEWMALDPSAREEFQAECWRSGTPRRVGEIADHAAKLLKEKLAQVPQVTDVSIEGDRIARRARLCVSTVLHEGEKLPGVPDEFAGFAVVQYGTAEMKRRFLARLEFALLAAKFSESEVRSWLDRHDESLNKIGSVYYIESPCRWIAQAMVAGRGPSGLVGGPLVELHGKVQEVLMVALDEGDPADGNLHTDVVPRLRANLERVFAEYGIRL